MGGGVQAGGRDVTAMEMTKWFDTNYHYIVPEFDRGQSFRLASPKPVDEFQEAKALGFHTKPVLIGPVTFVLLGKSRAAAFDRLELLDALLPVYGEVLTRLAAAGPERESTRLNSRHPVISDAGLCLKKKKIHITIVRPIHIVGL